MLQLLDEELKCAISTKLYFIKIFLNYYSNLQVKDYSMTTNIYDNIYENNMKTEKYFVKVKLLSKILKYKFNEKCYTSTTSIYIKIL